MLLAPEVVTAVVALVAAWMAGVGYAAYRAVGWVERIRAWAHSSQAEPVPGLAGQEIDSMGVN